MISGCMGSSVQVPFSQGLPSPSEKGNHFCMIVHSATCRPKILKRLWLSTPVRWDGLLPQEAGGQAKYSVASPTCLHISALQVAGLPQRTVSPHTVQMPCLTSWRVVGEGEKFSVSEGMCCSSTSKH